MVTIAAVMMTTTENAVATPEGIFRIASEYSNVGRTHHRPQCEPFAFHC